MTPKVLGDATRPVALSCYIERRGEGWEAVCPDLNFAAMCHSVLGAQESLDRRIRKHIKYIESFPEKDRPAFYPRCASLSARCGRALSAVWAVLFSRPLKESAGHRLVYTFDFAA